MLDARPPIPSCVTRIVFGVFCFIVWCVGMSLFFVISRDDFCFIMLGNPGCKMLIYIVIKNAGQRTTRNPERNSGKKKKELRNWLGILVRFNAAGVDSGT